MSSRSIGQPSLPHLPASAPYTMPEIFLPSPTTGPQASATLSRHSVRSLTPPPAYSADFDAASAEAAGRAMRRQDTRRSLTRSSSTSSSSTPPSPTPSTAAPFYFPSGPDAAVPVHAPQRRAYAPPRHDAAQPGDDRSQQNAVMTAVETQFHGKSMTAADAKTIWAGLTANITPRQLIGVLAQPRLTALTAAHPELAKIVGTTEKLLFGQATLQQKAHYATELMQHGNFDAAKKCLDTIDFKQKDVNIAKLTTAAAKYGYPHMVEHLMEIKGWPKFDQKSFVSNGGNSLLITAVKSQQTDGVKSFLHYIDPKKPKSIDGIDYQNVLGETALHYAAAGDNKDIVRHILQAGAAHDVVSVSGQTPLEVATRADSVHAVSTLLQFANSADRGMKTKFVLDRAIDHGAEKVVRSVVGNGQNYTIMIQHAFGLIRQAVEADKPAIVRQLAQHEAAKPWLKERGATLLKGAIAKRSAESYAALADAGVSICDQDYKIIDDKKIVENDDAATLAVMLRKVSELPTRYSADHLIAASARAGGRKIIDYLRREG